MTVREPPLQVDGGGIGMASQVPYGLTAGSRDSTGRWAFAASTRVLYWQGFWDPHTTQERNGACVRAWWSVRAYVLSAWQDQLDRHVDHRDHVVGGEIDGTLQPAHAAYSLVRIAKRTQPV